MNSTTRQEQEFSLERISRLIADLEQEVAHADVPHAAELREEIATLKQILASPAGQEDLTREKLHTIRGTLQDMTAKVEGEVLRDTPYITEIGRILGLV